MSVTIPYIELGKETRKYSAQLQPKIDKDDTATGAAGGKHFGQSGDLLTESNYKVVTSI